jgi:aerobic carbon-monoxide dehydrogenase medium subunit
MIPGQFDYVRPRDLDEALRILRDREGEAKILSGGYSLLPLLKLRLAQPGVLVDLKAVAGLDGIEEHDDVLVIGARATHRAILEHPVVRDRYPMLTDAAALIGDPQVRNWGTMGGSVAHADPAADWPSILCALRATIVVRSLDGKRKIAARDFFLDTFVTAIEPTEILVKVKIPAPAPRSGGAYEKLERKAGDFATAATAVQVSLAEDGSIGAAGLALTNVAERVLVPEDAEALLVGATPSEELYRQVGAAAAAASRPVSDQRGPAEYKRAMAAEMTVRALRRAVARARGEA